MTPFTRLARQAALAAAALCAFAIALGGWPSAGETKQAKPEKQQGAQQSPQPPSPADEKAAAQAAAHKAYDVGLKEFANGRLPGAVDQLSVAIKSGGLTPAEMAKALYTRGLAYKKQNKAGLAISDLTSALWLKNGLGDSEREAATRERTDAYRMAGLNDSGSVPSPSAPVVAHPAEGPKSDGAGLSAKAIAEAASGSSGAPVAQPVTRQDPSSEAARDAARARAAYASQEQNAPVVQSATVGPSAWSTSEKQTSVPPTAFEQSSGAAPAPVTVSGTFTLLKPVPQTAVKPVAATPAATPPVVLRETKAEAVPTIPAPPPAPKSKAAPLITWSAPTVQVAPKSPPPAAQSYAASAPTTAALPLVPAKPAPTSPSSVWTPPPEPATVPVHTASLTSAPPPAQPVSASPPPSSTTVGTPWTPPPQQAAVPAAPPASAPADAARDQSPTSVPSTPASYVSNLFASDLPTPPASKAAYTDGAEASDSNEPESMRLAAEVQRAYAKEHGTKLQTRAKPEKSAAKGAKAGKYKVHIAALRSREEAEALAEKITAEHGADLANHVPVVDETVIGSMGKFYRVRVSGYTSKEESSGLCNKLRSSGLDCLVVTN